MTVSATYSSPLTSNQIQHLCLRNLNAVNGSHQLLPNRYDRVYTRKKTDIATVYIEEMRDASWGGETIEGGQPNIATSGEGILSSFPVKLYTNSQYATLPALQDNLYKGQWSFQSNGFVRAQDVLRNIILWKPFNNANNMESRLGDGQPMLSTRHLVSEGTFANTWETPVGLSKGALEYMTTSVQLFTSFAMYPANLMVLGLEVAVPLLPLAQTLIFSPEDPTTANRASNSLSIGRYFPEGVAGNPYFKDSSAFFGRTNEEMGFAYWVKAPPTVEALPLTSTLTMGFVMYERFASGLQSARAIYGSSMFI